MVTVPDRPNMGRLHFDTTATVYQANSSEGTGGVVRSPHVPCEHDIPKRPIDYLLNDGPLVRALLFLKG